MKAARAATWVHSRTTESNLAIRKSSWEEVILAQSCEWQLQVSLVKKKMSEWGKQVIWSKEKACGCGETAKVA